MGIQINQNELYLSIENTLNLKAIKHPVIQPHTLPQTILDTHNGQEAKIILNIYSIPLQWQIETPLLHKQKVKVKNPP